MTALLVSPLSERSDGDCAAQPREQGAKKGAITMQNRTRYIAVGVLSVLLTSVARAGTPGQITKFGADGATPVDSVASEDGSGNIGIGTSTPAAKLDITGGNVNLDNSTATSGTILKAGVPFLHNFGLHNTFLGLSSGNATMSGVNNTGTGYNVLMSLTSGNNNTASGYSALGADTTGNINTALGFFALSSNQVANFNVALGAQSLSNLVYGDGNTAVGEGAGSSLQQGFYNIYLGNGAGANPFESYTIRIGEPTVHSRFFAAGVYNSPVVGAYVCVNSNSQLGYCVIPAGPSSDEVQKQQHEIEALRARLEALEQAVAASASASR